MRMNGGMATLLALAERGMRAAKVGEELTTFAGAWSRAKNNQLRVLDAGDTQAATLTEHVAEASMVQLRLVVEALEAIHSHDAVGPVWDAVNELRGPRV